MHGQKGGKDWVGIIHGEVEERAVHVKETVNLEHGGNMFRFTGSFGWQDKGVQSALDRINWSVCTQAQKEHLET